MERYASVPLDPESLSDMHEPHARNLTRRWLIPVVGVVATLLLTPARADAPPASSPDSYVLTFCGDTGFGAFYESHDLEAPGTHILESRGYDYGFSAVKRLVADSDALIVNLETAITARSTSPLDEKKGYLHAADPQRAPEALSRIGVDVVSLANNHTLDFGRDGLADTIAALDAAMIHSFGAGDDLLDAGKPLVLTATIGRREQEIVILGSFEHRLRYHFDYDFYADAGRSGVYPLSKNMITEQVRDARMSHPDAIIIAFPHWGSNYKWATKNQRTLARDMVEAGCDMIIGHGAHMMQEIERIDDALVIYGIGNFVFNSPGRYKKDGCVPYSLIARLSLSIESEDLVGTVTLYPILSDNLKTNYRPRPLDQIEALVATTELVGRSTEELSASLRPSLDDRGWKLELEAFRTPLLQRPSTGTGPRN